MSGKSARKPITPKAPRSLVEIVTTDESQDEGVPVFAIDGEVYTMPTAVSASIALKALDVRRREGEDAATSWMMEEVLGTEAYNALKECRGLTGTQLSAIIDHVVEHTMGALEGATGK